MRQTPETAAGYCPRPQPEPCPGQLPAHITVDDPGVGPIAIRIDQAHVRLTWCENDTEIVRLVPIDDYMGLVIAVRNAPGGEEAYVALRHADPSLTVQLSTVFEDHEVDDLMRAWQIWAESLGVEQLVEMANGILEPVPGRAKARTVARRPAPRRVNPHFRSRRPNPMTGARPGAPMSGAEIIARR